MLLLFVMSAKYAIGQGENNNWCFGKNLGISFNGSTPSVFTNNMEKIGTSISDANGNLLFCATNGGIWDRNHTLMPNGMIVPDSSAWAGWQRVQIVQSPVDNDQYYIVATGFADSNSNKAFYSVVDMTLNNGLGDIVPGQSHILLTNNVASAIVCAKINGGCDGYWIILHEEGLTMRYKAFKLDATSTFTDSVISTGLQFGNQNVIPTMCLSANSSRLVRASSKPSPFPNNGSIETAEFDVATGVLSNFQYINTNLEDVHFPIFSPNGSKLYVSEDGLLYQYNIALMPNVNAVKASRTSVTNNNGIFAGSRIAPDSKLYSIRYDQSINQNIPGYLAVINYPNNPVATCGYSDNGIALPPNPPNSLFTLVELGNPAAVKSPADTIINQALDTILCHQSNLILTSDVTYSWKRWNDGSSSDQKTITQPGSYWLYGIKNCKLYIDTFNVHYPNFQVDLGKDTFLCKGSSIVLDANISGITAYLWQDASTASVFTVQNEGVYSVSVTHDGCTISDTIKIELIKPTLEIIEHDTTICIGDHITLHSITTPESEFQWSNGSITDQTVTNLPGIYKVTANNICGTFSDQINITEKICPCVVVVPNAFTPNGDGNNDMFNANINCPQIGSYHIVVYNRFGQKVFESHDINKGWDGNFNGQIGNVGTYFYYLQYRNNINQQMISKKGDVLLLR